MSSKLYDEINVLWKSANALREEFPNTAEMPQEKLNDLNGMLDKIEELQAKAKTAERMESIRSTGFPTRNGRDGEPAPFGFAPVSDQVKSLASAMGMDATKIRPSSFVIGDSSYDPDRAVKHQIAAAMAWKYGTRDLDKVLNMLPKEMRGLAAELKDLATMPGGAGGYLVGDTQLRRLIELQGDENVMRQIANVLPPIPGGSAITPSEENELSDAEWTHELGTGSFDTVQPFGQRVLTPHPVAKGIKISRTLLRAATLLDVEGWVINRLSRKFDEAEENAFINGDGSQKPFGLLSDTAIASQSTAASNTLGADDIINWAYQLGSGYQRNAVILANRSFIRKVRLLKGTDNNYLWQPGLAQGSPATILDWPYRTSDAYPTGLTADAFDDNALVATIGDFSYYWIVDSLNFEVQRLEELYAASNQVGFIGRKETDGMVVNAAAFRHLKILA